MAWIALALALNLPLSLISLHRRETILYGKTGFISEREFSITFYLVNRFG